MADNSATPNQHDALAGNHYSGPSLVLAAYDRSDGSSHALSYAAGLAARSGAYLVVLNVNGSLAPDCTTGARGCVDEIVGEVQQVVAGGVPGCEVAFNAGDPAVVIHRLARDLHADLIVVGQSRHRWMHPLGSVPARLAQHAQQPVLIVP